MYEVLAKSYCRLQGDNDKSNVSQVTREYGYVGHSEWSEAASGAAKCNRHGALNY